MSNILTAKFDRGRSITVGGLWQYDYGQILKFCIDVCVCSDHSVQNSGAAWNCQYNRR